MSCSTRGRPWPPYSGSPERLHQPGIGEGPVGVRHALRGRDVAVHQPAAFLVPGPVQRFENLARELAGFLEHADRELGVHFLAAGKLGHAAIEVEDLPEQEGDVVNGGGVCSHDCCLMSQLRRSLPWQAW